MAKEAYLTVNAEIESMFLGFPAIRKKIEETNGIIKAIREELLYLKNTEGFSSIKDEEIDEGQQLLVMKHYLANLEDPLGGGLSNNESFKSLILLDKININDWVQKFNYEFIWDGSEGQDVLEESGMEMPAFIESFVSTFDVKLDLFKTFISTFGNLIKDLAIQCGALTVINGVVPFGQVFTASANLVITLKESVQQALVYKKSILPENYQYYSSLLYIQLCSSIEKESLSNLEESGKEVAKDALLLAAAFIPFGIGAIINTISEAAKFPLAVYALYQTWLEAKEIDDKLASAQVKGTEDPITLEYINETPLLAAAYILHSDKVNAFLDSANTNPLYLYSNINVVAESFKQYGINPSELVDFVLGKLQDQFMNERKAALKLVKNSSVKIIANLLPASGRAATIHKRKSNFSNLQNANVMGNHFPQNGDATNLSDIHITLPEEDLIQVLPKSTNKRWISNRIYAANNSGPVTPTNN
jgi:hypothetical protein